MNHIYTHLLSENHLEDKVVSSVYLTLAHLSIVNPYFAVDTYCDLKILDAPLVPQFCSSP